MVGVGPRGPVWTLGGAYAPPSTFLDVIGAQNGGAPLDGQTLTVALDVVQAWAVLVTVGFTLVLFLFLAFCVCAKKDDGYDEFELDQGITTVKVCHDGGENGLGAFPPRINGSGGLKGSEDGGSEASSRCTLKRELPAIPQSAQPEPGVTVGGCGVERTQSQHSSDLYAAVGDVGDGGGSSVGKVIGGVQVLPSGAIGPDGRAAIIRDPHLPSSTPTSPTDPPVQPPRSEGGVVPGGMGQAGVSHPYAKVKKNHPYAHVKLPKKEHPYAKVVRDDSEDPETDTDNYDDPKAIAKDSKLPGWESEGGYEPAPPVPEKRFDIEEETALGSAPATQEPPSPRPTAPPEQPPEIQAALAISGRTPANEEMPYMTPPLHHAGVEGSQQQQNFSGDSQDSRGYTSISVREPLAALKAQSQVSGPSTQPSATPHALEGEGYYMTVSDDSADEMYACIYEGSGRGGAGSETYAQIEPRSSPPPPLPSMPSSPPPNAPSTPSPLSSRSGGGGGAGVTQQEPPPPAPPSVDSLKHVVHSRQASSSSAASTVMGSPGAEKRGTRSPLPPLPQGDPSLYTTTPTTAPQQLPPPPHSPPRPTPTPERPTQRALEEMYAKVMKKQRSGHSRGDSCGGGGGESDAASTTSSSSRRGSVDAARWSAHASPPVTPRQSVDLGSMTRSLVETRPTHEAPMAMSRAKSYEKGGVWAAAPPPAPPPNPNYETIPQQYPGSDPGYETVKTSEPAYASVERPDDHYPGYETVKATSDLDSESGYETLKHRQDEPGYETVTGQAVTHPPSEPGYETVTQEEPGYETVTHPRPDPGYEELKFTSRRSSQGEMEPGYEIVKEAQTEGTYELVRDYDTQGTPAFSNQEPIGPLYATVHKSPTTTSSPQTLAQTQPVPPPQSQESQARKDSEKDLNLPLTKLVDIPPERTSPTTTQSPKAASPSTKSPDKSSPVSDKSSKGSPLSRKNSRASSAKSPAGSPPAVKSPIASQPVLQTPEQDSPPMMKSPSPDIESPPARKSPESSPPALLSLDKESPPIMKSPSPDIELPPVCKSPKSSPPALPSPDRESPPMMKSPSPDLDIPAARKSPRASPPAAHSPGKETSLLMKSPSLDVEPPPPGQESPSMTKSPSPDLEVSCTQQEGLNKGAGVTKSVGFDVAALSRKSSSSSSQSESPVQATAPTTLPATAPTKLISGAGVGESENVGIESTSSIQLDFPPSVPSQLVTQDLDMEATTSFSEEGGPEGIPAGLNDNLEESSAPTVSEEAETLPMGPAPPEVCGGEREASPLAFSSLGSEDLPPPLAAEEAHTQPQETVNPLYLLDDLNGGDQTMMVGPDAGQEEPGMLLCGDLPPPPPSDLPQQDNVFTNDLPPPMPESSPMMPRTSTLCDDEAPPPLVPPGEVEGLEDLMGLGSGAGAGSSSSGSTAGQPGSLHANSDKDSDSPQDPSGLEGAAEDLPPPPPLSETTANRESDEEVDNSVSSGYEQGFTASGVTVTVNPISDPEDSEGSPVSVLPPPPPPPSEATDLPSDIASQSDLPSDAPAPVPDLPSDIPSQCDLPSDVPPQPDLSSDVPHPDLPSSDTPHPLPPPLSDTPELPPPPPSDTSQPISDTSQSPPPPSSDTPQPPPPPPVDTPEPPPLSDTPQPPPPPPTDTSQPPPPPPPPPVDTFQPLPPPSPVVAVGSQSSSSGSGSQDTGSGSAESVVTAGTGTGQDQAPSDSSPGPPETQNLDQHEQITPV